eukprot:m.133877 g.133877  ORF g.133877 m.133877 type:complete len:529 (-) comp16899_c0_seq1:13-1599(-)
MNLALLDPSTQDFPEIIEDCLEDSVGVTCAFNRRGTLLAVGCNSGTVVVWDFDTRSVARSLVSHVQPVTAVCWSRSGRKLLSASLDGSVAVWDVLGYDLMFKYKFPGPVLTAQLHPRNDHLFVACPMMSAPEIVDTRLPDKPDAQAHPDARRKLPVDIDVESLKTGATSSSRKNEQGIVACFSKRGDLIYSGSPRGTVTAIDCATLNAVQSVQVSTATGGSVKSLRVSKRGDALIVNSADRTVRVYRTDGLELENKFQDLVNRIQWKTCLFSRGGEYIIAGAAQQAQHHIYIWDRASGNLVKILEGPKEGLVDVAWHPLRPCIASISTFGLVYIWSVNHTENWSAFAPDFKELEENVEYIEREDEFDDVDEIMQTRKQEETDEFVDIITVDKITYGSSDEEPLEEDELVYLPTEPIHDVPEGTQDTAEGDGASGGRAAATAAPTDEENQTPSKRKKRTAQDGASKGDGSTKRKASTKKRARKSGASAAAKSSAAGTSAAPAAMDTSPDQQQGSVQPSAVAAAALAHQP